MTADQPPDAHPAYCPADPQARPARVVSALVRQLDLYARLEALSRRQSLAIEQGDTDGLLGILGERQVVVDQIADIGATLEPIRLSWDAFLSGLPPATREQVRGLVESLAQVAGAVALRDEADRRRLEARRAAVGEELASVARGRSAVLAYGGRAAAIPVFQDREV